MRVGCGLCEGGLCVRVGCGLCVRVPVGEGWAKWTRWAKRKTQITLRCFIIKLSNFDPL